MATAAQVLPDLLLKGSHHTFLIKVLAHQFFALRQETSVSQPDSLVSLFLTMPSLQTDLLIKLMADPPCDDCVAPLQEIVQRQITLTNLFCQRTIPTTSA
jgi:hypothetical protein